jgi:hypothetical protein
MTSVLVLVSLAVLPASALGQTNVTGTWVLTLDSPTGPTNLDVTLKQDGEALTGELISPIGTAPFKGTLIKDVLTVNASLDLQGTQLVLVFSGKVANDAMIGNVKLGDFGEAPWTAKRKAAAAPAPPAASAAAAATTSAPAAAGSGIAGKWAVQLEVPGNPLALTAVFNQKGDAVTGTFTSPQGELPVTGTITGNALKLEFAAPGGMSVTMTGQLSGSTLAGKASIAGLGELDWTGKRSN